MTDGIYSLIYNDVAGVIEQLRSDRTTAVIHPAAVARAVFNSWGENPAPKAEWCEVEQLKQIARLLLRKRHEHESDENEAYQGDMFSGHLQSFYPIPPGQDGEASYKRLELLDDEEIQFNVSTLRKQANARLQHADALEAFGRSRQNAA